METKSGLERKFIYEVSFASGYDFDTSVEKVKATLKGNKECAYLLWNSMTLRIFSDTDTKVIWEEYKNRQSGVISDRS